MATFAKSLAGPGIVSPVLELGLYINGTDLNDTLYGTAYADAIHGRFGNDFLSGGAGDDLLFGEQGNDSLFGGTGNDRLDGGAGNDLLTGGSGADALIGGDGFDTVSYASSNAGVSVNLLGTVGSFGDAEGDTYSSIEKLVGSSFGDSLRADDSGMVFDGGNGNDEIWGGAGLDVINGGAGDDSIMGRRGIDVLTGGGGSDAFIFNWDDGPDLITDFQSGVDKIGLRDGFGLFPLGRDSELWTGTELPQGNRPRGDEDRLFYDTDDHQLYQLNGFNEATLLATFSNGAQLQTSDFFFL
jgi:Ca2+-binding RTX toxin-like protein